MDLVGQSVKHKTLGVGTVQTCSPRYLTVCFGRDVKTFVYPDSFRQYLTAMEPDIAEQIRQELEKADAERERREARRREEAKYLTRGVVIPGKHSSKESLSEPYGEEQDSD